MTPAEKAALYGKLIRALNKIKHSDIVKKVKDNDLVKSAEHILHSFKNDGFAGAKKTFFKEKEHLAKKHQKKMKKLLRKQTKSKEVTSLLFFYLELSKKFKSSSLILKSTSSIGGNSFNDLIPNNSKNFWVTSYKNGLPGVSALPVFTIKPSSINLSTANVGSIFLIYSIFARVQGWL